MAAERIRVLNCHLVPSQPAANATAAAATAVSLARDFRYTLDNPRFTLEQRQFYEDNGYIVFPRLVGEELLEECADRFRALCDGKVERGAITLMADVSLRQKGAKGEYLYNKAQDIAYDDVSELFVNKLYNIRKCRIQTGEKGEIYFTFFNVNILSLEHF
ncbi:Phytanoyl-CoA dioxygenase, peroxisomal [Gryllus bimaculatus]|nr:Phytanoyl-CoA dioxygenase, peroxisomal [Gryllus bimaculatus]